MARRKAPGVPNEQERLIEIGTHEVRTSVGGAGPPLLMLNGLGASLEVLTPLRRALPDFTTIAFDPPGVGRSRPLSMPMRLSGHADAAVRTLDVLGFDKVDVCGVSWGGALSQELAWRHPDRVGKVILTSTTAGPMLLASPGTYAAFLDPRARTSDDYINRIAPRLFGGKARTAARDLFDLGVFHHLASKRSRSYLVQMSTAAGWSSWRYIWRLRQEVLIVTGDDDPLVRPYNSTLLHMAIPNPTLKVIKGEGHFLIVTSAEELAAMIREFLKPAEAGLEAA